ncbi:hypothetical protein LY76DRAFT_272604 [Colletotrichum caudatum]|nr:hypothetical protein LY76DRAFT_272604 [Colletotrichum caudatum]
MLLLTLLAKHPSPRLTDYTPPSNQDEIDNARPTALPGIPRYDASSAPPQRSSFIFFWQPSLLRWVSLCFFVVPNGRNAPYSMLLPVSAVAFGCPRCGELKCSTYADNVSRPPLWQALQPPLAHDTTTAHLHLDIPCFDLVRFDLMQDQDGPIQNTIGPSPRHAPRRLTLHATRSTFRSMAAHHPSPLCRKYCLFRKSSPEAEQIMQTVFFLSASLRFNGPYSRSSYRYQDITSRSSRWAVLAASAWVCVQGCGGTSEVS